MQLPGVDSTFWLRSTYSLGSQLIASLRERIVRGELAPGTRLSEQDIATSYGLSRQPVREAFIRLAGEGLLDVRPQRGTFVRKILVGEVETSRFVREAVEADLVRLAAGAASEGDIAQLHDMLDEQTQVLTREAGAFMRLDEQFHRSLAEIAGKPGAWTHLEPIKMHMDRVRYLTVAEFPLDRLVREHRTIVEAIARHDPDAAEAAVRLHLRGVLSDLPLIVSAQPDCFEPGPDLSGPAELLKGRTS